MELYIVRHAMEVDHGQISADADRALSDNGRRRMERATESWRAIGVAVDGILSSPFVRAMQTAEIAGKALRIADRVEACPRLAAGASPEDIIELLGERCDDDHRVMVVGHEPDLGRLVSLLVCGDDRAGFRMKKGGLTKLTVDHLEVDRCAVLEFHLWPRHLVRMS